jgi:2-polyprenyl-3-methyl-5-hydroxy-6-metoxy-1,4-benzoquinol methylase
MTTTVATTPSTPLDAPGAQPDPAELDAFLGRAVPDMAAAAAVPLVLLGERLGLYRLLADGGPLTAPELGELSGTHPRLVREWLAAQAAGGYVSYDPAAHTFWLTPAQAFVLADDTSPVYLGGLVEVLSVLWTDLDKVVDGFRTGRGLAWHEHNAALFHGTERFFRPGYAAHLVPEWLPALEGVVAKLEQGATVADIGCGHGASTIIMAAAYPRSRFTGFDYHPPSVERARASAAEAGVGDRVSFEVAAATEIPAGGYDLVAAFDCLHDMGDPLAAARRVREALAPDGTWLVVEPFAGDSLSDNLNPVGRLFYAVSTQICTAHGVAQGDDDPLGAQAGEAQLRGVFERAGFTRARRAAETPFNLVLEVRP